MYEANAVAVWSSPRPASTQRSCHAWVVHSSKELLQGGVALRYAVLYGWAAQSCSVCLLHVAMEPRLRWWLRWHSCPKGF